MNIQKAETIKIDWRDFVHHSNAVRIDDTLEAVQHRFLECETSYLAVLERNSCVGLCSRQEIGMSLGSKYGFSLFARMPVREHLLQNPLFIRTSQPWTKVLRQVFSRTEEGFFDDVLLLGENEEFLGLIQVQSLVCLQTRLLTHTIEQLEEQRAEIALCNRRMTEELLMARKMQLAMLSHDQPLLQSGNLPRTIRVLHHYFPLGMVSGDFYEVLSISETVVGLFIADAMGHGVQAALVTTMMRALVQSHSALASEPGRFLAAINQSLCEIFACCELPMFISGLYLLADMADGSLRYANAGHPCPLLLRRASGMAIRLDCMNIANGGILGVTANARFETAQHDLQEEDLLLLFTDGLFEVENPNGVTLGQEGLAALATRLAREPAELLLAGLLERARIFSATGRFHDDVCLLGMEVLAPESPRIPSAADTSSARQSVCGLDHRSVPFDRLL